MSENSASDLFAHLAAPFKSQATRSDLPSSIHSAFPTLNRPLFGAQMSIPFYAISTACSVTSCV